MHDVRWVTGETIESTLPKLRSEWIGNIKGLHIDSYKHIQYVDGYRISLVNRNKIKDKEINKLWFINLGGYKEGELYEQHHLELVVAPSIQIAKQKARKRWLDQIEKIHKDDHTAIMHIQDYSLLLRPDPQGRDDGMIPDWKGYWLIN